MRDDDDRDYDKPRRRRRRDDDDDEYDDDYDSRPRSGRSSKKGMNVALIVGIVLAILVVCAGLGGYAMFSSITKVKESATRMRDSNNLKQVGLAMHYVNDDLHQGFFAPIAHDKNGNPVASELSFRVSLLPYIEQQILYNQFDLTAGWDSPRNRPAAQTIVPTFGSPFATAPSGPTTPYRAFVGGGSMFDENGKPVPVTQIRDGMGNTIMLMAVDEEVPWAAPRELKYSPTGPLPSLGTRATPEGSNVLLADGSVKFLKVSTPEVVLRSLITRAGGDVMPVDW